MHQLQMSDCRLGLFSLKIYLTKIGMESFYKLAMFMVKQIAATQLLLLPMMLPFQKTHHVLFPFLC